MNDLTDLSGCEAVIDEHLSAGHEVILQYSKPAYTAELLEAIDALCRRYGGDLQLRFYGHYGGAFDCRVLYQVPSVISLAVDCLRAATHVEAIHGLEHLQALSLGVDELSAPDILAGENLRRLHTLSVGESLKPVVDLDPIARMSLLRELSVSGQTRNIEAIGDAPALQSLRLRTIGKSAPLDFVNRIRPLRALGILLGGRPDLAGVTHPGLQSLEIIRVRGLERLDPSTFPALASLQVEDQPKLPSLAFTEASGSLEYLRFANCRGLISLTGLARLGRLRMLSVYDTGLDLDALVQAGLPPNLSTFAFYTGKATIDRGIRDRLQRMGYDQSRHA